MLTPYYRCWMNYPLFLNVNHVRATYILVYLSESLTTKGLSLVNCVTFFSRLIAFRRRKPLAVTEGHF